MASMKNLIPSGFTSDLVEPDFWLGLGQIIWINVILSGDNAVVIALSLRHFPVKFRRFDTVAVCVVCVCVCVSIYIYIYIYI